MGDRLGSAEVQSQEYVVTQPRLLVLVRLRVLVAGLLGVGEHARHSGRGRRWERSVERVDPARP